MLGMWEPLPPQQELPVRTTIAGETLRAALTQHPVFTNVSNSVRRVLEIAETQAQAAAGAQTPPSQPPPTAAEASQLRMQARLKWPKNVKVAFVVPAADGTAPSETRKLLLHDVLGASCFTLRGWGITANALCTHPQLAKHLHHMQLSVAEWIRLGATQAQICAVRQLRA